MQLIFLLIKYLQVWGIHSLLELQFQKILNVMTPIKMSSGIYMRKEQKTNTDAKWNVIKKKNNLEWEKEYTRGFPLKWMRQLYMQFCERMYRIYIGMWERKCASLQGLQFEIIKKKSWKNNLKKLKRRKLDDQWSMEHYSF